MVSSNIDVDLALAGDGTLSLQINALSEAAMPWSLTTTLSGKPGEDRALEARLQSLPTNELVEAFGRLTGFPRPFRFPLTMRARMTKEGVITDVGLQVAGSTTGAIPPTKAGIEQIHDFGVVANWQKSSNTIAIERMQFSHDETRVALSGMVIVPPDLTSPIRFEIGAGQALTSRIVNGRRPPLIERIRSKGSFDPVSRILTLEQSEFGSGPSGSVAMQGQIDFSAPHPGLRLGIASSAMPLASFMTFWPSSLLPQARGWVRQNEGRWLYRARILCREAPRHAGALSFCQR